MPTNPTAPTGPRTALTRKLAFSTRAFSAAALALASGLLTAQATQAAPRPAAHSPAHAVRPAVTSSTNDVTLDFVGADINDVLKALAMQTRTNIVSGTEVKGPITVSLAHVSLEEALDLITNLSGFQYARKGNTYVVGSLTSIGMVKGETTAAIHFDFSDSGDLLKSLNATFPNTKLSLIKTAGGGTKTKEVKGVDDKGNPTTNKEVETVASTGGVISATGTQDDIAAVRDFIANTESSFPESKAPPPPPPPRVLNLDTSSSIIYNIKYASADDLQATLGRLVPSVLVTPGPAQRTYAPAPSTADAGGVTSATTSYGAASVPTAGGDGGVAVAGGGVTTSVSGSVPVKPTTTSLLLTGSDTDLARARQLLAQVDLRPVQINYEAKITEISLQKADELGLTYDFSGAIATIGEELPQFVQDVTGKLIQGTAANTPDPYPGQPQKLRTFGRNFITNFVTVQLHALVTSGDAKILASPNISAIDGQPAATFVGDTVSYISSVTQSPTGQNITTSTVNAGIKLFVTGKVNNDGYITLNVHPEVSIVTLTPAGAGGVQVPDVRIREATTTVRVKDGDYIAISGLINDQMTKDIQKVPILGDLPFFGPLFRDTKKTHTRDEVLIFLKVSVQKDTV